MSKITFYAGLAISMGIIISPVWFAINDYPEWCSFSVLAAGLMMYAVTLFTGIVRFRA